MEFMNKAYVNKANKIMADFFAKLHPEYTHFDFGKRPGMMVFQNGYFTRATVFQVCDTDELTALIDFMSKNGFRHKYQQTDYGTVVTHECEHRQFLPNDKNHRIVFFDNRRQSVPVLLVKQVYSRV